MDLWLLRGLVMAAVITFVRAVLGIGIYTWPESGGVQRTIALVVVILVALAWPFFDGRRDAYENEDPEDRSDLTLLWLKAMVVAGVVSGAASWILSFIFPGASSQSLLFELTIGAGFMVILLSIPAQIGILSGRAFGERSRRRSAPPEEVDEFGRHHIQAHHQKGPVETHHALGASSGTAAGTTTLEADEYSDQDFAEERAHLDDDDRRGTR
ncbi:B-4DMT family transporter [Hoyosella sp. YIM 151337]|uniref:B-4DMT family transporter n=1 Tax=Hoyosella sp. YIM 151337 TaxID=2992742 RepID=UPI002235F4F3|nr:B-4DMT family transporter [Hoyosella sp. YIM 151337]MCW4353220.1 B-4DMT family transporter [Hoyosella sp. YIM 151337]